MSLPSFILKALPGCSPSCGACPDRALEYSVSEAKKRARLVDLFSGFPVRWQNDSFPKIGYRRSVSLRVERLNGQWCAGTVDRDENLTAIPDCPVHRPEVNAALADLFQIMNQWPDLPWFAVSIQGPYLSIGLKCSPKAQWPALLHRQSGWVQFLEKNHLSGIFLQCDPSMGNRRWSSKGWSNLGLVRAMTPMPHGLGLETHLMFSQQRLELWKQCLNSAMDFLTTPEPYQFLDLYCGNGVARSFLKVEPVRSLGVELSAASIEAAKHWGVSQNWKEAEFLRGRVKDRIPQILEWIHQGRLQGLKTRTYVNPSRLGVETELIHHLKNEIVPERMAYLSCNPKTLKRDLSLLLDGGLSAESITGYDFFPYTRQVEALVLLRNPNS